jgi:hypothetical protein
MGGETDKLRKVVKRYTSTDKDRLLKLLHEERAELRCELVHGLTQKKDSITLDIDEQIIRIDMQISSLNSEKLSLKTKKEKLLKENNLLHLDSSRGTCTISDVHPQLREFDKQTRELERSILELPVR